MAHFVIVTRFFHTEIVGRRLGKVQLDVILIGLLLALENLDRWIRCELRFQILFA